jgi:hypothetical protein
VPRSRPAQAQSPGGLLLLTFHGSNQYDGIPETMRPAFQARGFAYVRSGSTPGLPDFYQVGFHTLGYVRDHWSRYVEVLDVLERAINWHQDVAVCRVPR